MKIFFKITLFLFLVLFTFQNCEDMDDVPPTPGQEINDFVWKGLNLYYLWQADVPNLSDNRFPNQAQLNTFLEGYTKPEELFDALKFDKSIDRFSWIVSDYLELENSFQGITKNSGINFILYPKSSNPEELIGCVRYIIPNSDAATKDIKRGTFFYAVDGTQLTKSNYKALLLNTENYTLNLAEYKNNFISPNGKSIELTKTVIAENPILINKVIEIKYPENLPTTYKIGYLMYNGFYPSYDKKLNDVFGSLESQGVTDLVLDLRYNSGGSVQSATRLASMITGQFTSEIFTKKRWNNKINSYFESEDPDALRNLFVDKMTIDDKKITLNSLKLTKVYILTSKSTASASELIINGLKPYIDVILIGDITTGKNVGSITIYDSPNFGKKNRNPNHRYAMQPIVFKTVNVADFGDYFKGISPNITQKEDITNLGELGTNSDPLLNTAIEKITGKQNSTKKSKFKSLPYFEDSKSILGQNQMYIEDAPAGLLRSLE